MSSSIARCVCAFVAVACSATAQQHEGSLLAGAAADLAAAQESLGNSFLQAAGIRVRFTLASSGILAHQIAQGAPYDIYLSANERYIQDLVASGHLVRESVRVYALGRVGLWSRTGQYKTLEDLRRKDLRHLAIPNPAHAPYGVAAREALEKLGLWRELEPKIVYGENVRQAFQYAESGNADAVLTAWSLVFDRGGVLITDQLHAPIRQAAGIVARTPNRAAAQKFIEYLLGPQGQAILRKWGLFPPPR